MTPEEIIKRPYARLLIPDTETGTFTGQVLEFPGCLAQGYTATEALNRLENAALGWLRSVIDAGQKIPEPIAENEFSGKLVLRLPRDIHRQASLIAAREAVSLNQWLVGIVARAVGYESPYERP